MNVICPKCKAENHLPDSLNRKTIYKCNACQTRFDRISKANFRKVAVLALIGWWIVPIFIWASRSVGQSVNEGSLRSLIVTFMFWWPMFLSPLFILAAAFFLWEGFRHRKFTGTSPKGFRAFIFASLLGFSGFAVGIALFVRSL